MDVIEYLADKLENRSNLKVLMRNLSFGHTLDDLLESNHSLIARRAGWSEDRYIFLSSAYVQDPMTGSNVPFDRHLICYREGVFSPWVCSPLDSIRRDWILYQVKSELI